MNDEPTYLYEDADGNICEGGFTYADDAVDLPVIAGTMPVVATVRVRVGDTVVMPVARYEGDDDERSTE